MDRKYSESERRLVIYYHENKEWLEELSKHAHPYLRAMDLTVIKNAREIIDR